jgi:hypothetical protein
MSRTTVMTKMTDRVLLKHALAALGVSFSEEGHRLRLLSADWEGVVINVETGAIDCAASQEQRAGRLRQHYAEAQFWAEATRTGIEIQSRTVDDDGNIVLSCRTSSST